MEVWKIDDTEGNDCPIGDVEKGLSTYDGCSIHDDPYEVVYIG